MKNKIIRLIICGFLSSIIKADIAFQLSARDKQQHEQIINYLKSNPEKVFLKATYWDNDDIAFVDKIIKNSSLIGNSYIFIPTDGKLKLSKMDFTYGNLHTTMDFKPEDDDKVFKLRLPIAPCDQSKPYETQRVECKPDEVLKGFCGFCFQEFKGSKNFVRILQVQQTLNKELQALRAAYAIKNQELQKVGAAHSGLLQSEHRVIPGKRKQYDEAVLNAANDVKKKMNEVQELAKQIAFKTRDLAAANLELRKLQPRNQPAGRPATTTAIAVPSTAAAEQAIAPLQVPASLYQSSAMEISATPELQENRKASSASISISKTNGSKVIIRPITRDLNEQVIFNKFAAYNKNKNFLTYRTMDEDAAFHDYSLTYDDLIKSGNQLTIPYKIDKPQKEYEILKDLEVFLGHSSAFFKPNENTIYYVSVPISQDKLCLENEKYKTSKIPSFPVVRGLCVREEKIGPSSSAAQTATTSTSASAMK